MNREFSIPLVLWVSAAIVVHAIGSGGVVGVTRTQEKLARERASIRGMVAEVRNHFDVVEVEVGEPSKEEHELEPPPIDDSNPLVSLLAPVAGVLDDLGIEIEEEKPEDKPEEPKVEPEEIAKPEPEKKEEEKEKPPDPKKPAELIVLKDKRISIRQSNDKDQPDNKDAPRLAEKANTVEEETIAKHRSTDQITKDPSPGSNQRGPTNEEGNSEKNKIAQSEEADGNPKRAPGESSDDARDNRHVVPRAPAVAANQGGRAGKPGPATGATGPSDRAPSPAVPGSLGGPGPAAPSQVTADDGFSPEVSEAAPGGAGVGMLPGTFRPAVPGSVASLVPKLPGLGVSGGDAGKMSLSWQGMVAAVGNEELERQRAAAGKKVRSEHRGRYDTDKFARFRPDLENYDPSVKVGNQTALNAAQSAFAGYLSTIHNAIHPIFAEEFLGLLNSLPRGHSLNEELVAHVEIILSRSEGKVLRMGIAKKSGNTAFDAAALDAIDRAQPFGVAPEAIVSGDGNIYLHWEFHRDPIDACSTRNAHPFIVKDPKPLKPSGPLKKTLKKPTPKKEGAPPAPPKRPPAKSGTPRKK